ADATVSELGAPPDAGPRPELTEKQTTGEPPEEAANRLALVPPQEGGNLLDGIHFYASLQEETNHGVAVSGPETPMTATSPAATTTQAEAAAVPATAPAHTAIPVEIHNELQKEPPDPQTSTSLPEQAPQPPLPPTIEYSSRN